VEVITAGRLSGKADVIRAYIMARHTLTEDEATIAMVSAFANAPAAIEDPELGLVLRYCPECGAYNYGA
jgi:hypothetical protein